MIQDSVVIGQDGRRMAKDRTICDLNGPKRLQKEAKRQRQKSNPFWFRNGAAQDPTMARPRWPEPSKMTPKMTPKKDTKMRSTKKHKLDPKIERKRQGLETPAGELEGQKQLLAAAWRFFLKWKVMG